MVRAKIIKCPECGLTLSTPDGEERLMRIMNMHSRQRHPSMDTGALRSLIRDSEINIPGPRSAVVEHRS